MCPSSFSWSWVWAEFVNDSEPQCYINADMGPGAVIELNGLKDTVTCWDGWGGIKGLWTLFFFWFGLLQCEYRPGSTELSRQVVLNRESRVGKVCRAGEVFHGLEFVVCMW